MNLAQVYRQRWRVRPHNDAVYLSLTQESNDLIGGHPRSDNYCARNARVPNVPGQRLQILHLGAGGC
jgi:hypothetical protein